MRQHRPDPCTLYIDVTAMEADCAAVDALAKLSLTARRCGYRIELVSASRELTELIEFAGLCDALPRGD